jgi:hypothetical protein
MGTKIHTSGVTPSHAVDHAGRLRNVAAGRELVRVDLVCEYLLVACWTHVGREAPGHMRRHCCCAWVVVVVVSSREVSQRVVRGLGERDS